MDSVFTQENGRKSQAMMLRAIMILSHLKISIDYLLIDIIGLGVFICSLIYAISSFECSFFNYTSTKTPPI
jgi:hypothetical protein